MNIVLQACRGLAVAHRAGIVHRDLKPENIFISDAGDGSDQIKVLDFGIAKLRTTDASVATGTGATFGTAFYMSPEQARGAGEVDHRSDVWSLGVVLYELLSGRKPFGGGAFLEVIHNILSTEPPSLGELRPDLPPKLVALVHQAIRKEIIERVPSVVAFAERLAPFVSAAQSVSASGLAETALSAPTQGAPVTVPPSRAPTGPRVRRRRARHPPRRRSRSPPRRPRWCQLRRSRLPLPWPLQRPNLPRRPPRFYRVLKPSGRHRPFGANTVRTSVGTSASWATRSPPHSRRHHRRYLRRHQRRRSLRPPRTLRAGTIRSTSRRTTRMAIKGVARRLLRQPRVGLLLMPLLMNVARPAVAQADNKAAARAHFEKGVAAFNDRHFAEAADEFETAYRLSPAFVVLYNIGEVDVALGKSVEAVDAFDEYLKQGASAISDQRRWEVLAMRGE